MTNSRATKIKMAERYIKDYDFEPALEILSGLLADSAADYEAFRLLYDLYVDNGCWDDAEVLIHAYAANYQDKDWKDSFLLTIYLGRYDVEKALETAQQMIASFPDFQEEIANIGYQFKLANLENDFLNLLERTVLPGYKSEVSLAYYHANYGRNYTLAIAFIQKALNHHPNDEILLSYLQRYEIDEFEQCYKVAKQKLSGKLSGDAVQDYKALLSIRPESVMIKEYYLSSIACRYFPPFYWYFHRNNFVGTAPYSGRAIFYLLFFLACALYYKSGKTLETTDHLQSVIWLFSALVIPRYTVFPLFVQILGLWYLPGYHLLQRPFDFLKGAIILFAWVQLLLFSISSTEIHGFNYFLVTGFIANVALIEFVQKLENGRLKYLFLIYIVISIGLGLASFFKIIPDVFLAFMIAGWMPPVLVGGLADSFKKIWEDWHSTSNDSLHIPGISNRIQQISIIAGSVGIILFIASAKMKAAVPTWLFPVSFLLVTYSFTLFSFSEKENNRPDFGWKWKNKPWFRWLFVLFSIGMWAGLLGLSSNGSRPIREYDTWIPFLALFLGSWAALFILHFYYRSRRYGD
jgi:tetratricopeptide (TPR) repeat protein